MLDGETVKVSDSRYGPLAVGIRNDHTFRHHVLVLVHLLFLSMLFLHTLGINGSTKLSNRPITRSFVTAVVANESDFGVDRISARQFSNCAIYTGPSISYYPLAFDTVESGVVSDPVGLRDEDGSIVPFNHSSFVCQSSNLDPLVVVPNCGSSALDCNNLNISSPATMVATRTEQPLVNTIVKFAGNPPPLLILHTSARLENISQPERHPLASYDRLICRQLPTRDAGSNPLEVVSFNCILGVWNHTASLFTFRLGSATTTANSSSIETWNELLDLGLPLTFTATTAQMSIEWHADLSGEDIFVEVLFILKNDMLTARAFLDLLVSRAVVPTFVNSNTTLLFEQVPVNVTDIHVGVVVGRAGDEKNILTWGGLSHMLDWLLTDENMRKDDSLQVSLRSLEKQMLQ
ncbi:hypothetical protein FGB62_172g03 [Gracilaria domingensis]|nr:hypothetical protein FGB62_172g03 [Gracilaria domingensis]